MANSSPKIAVVGSGAVGSYYGGGLARHGADVHFLMRGGLDAARRNGLTIRSTLGDFHLPKVHAHARTEEIGPCDFVLVATKSTSNPALPPLIAPLIGPDTSIVTLQNGLGNEEFLASHFGEK